MLCDNLNLTGVRPNATPLARPRIGASGRSGHRPADTHAESVESDPLRTGRKYYVQSLAGTEWCSWVIRHWPSILRKPTVSRNEKPSLSLGFEDEVRAAPHDGHSEGNVGARGYLKLSYVKGRAWLVILK